MYVMNAWYVAAWSSEVQGGPLARTVCESPLVLFRDNEGTVCALTDRCAHRGFPLSAGQVTAGQIQCGYHGFCFDAAGACTKTPGQEVITSRLQVRRYPTEELHGWIWVWMGVPENANPKLIPDTHWMTDEKWMSVRHTFQFACNYTLIHDNLLDLTHESFVHRSTVGDDYIVNFPLNVEVNGDTVFADRFMPGVDAPPLYASTMGISGPHDRFHTTEFRAPSHHTLHSGLTKPGRPREEGYLIKVLNAITPIDEQNSWYFYCFARNFALENADATEELRIGLGLVLEEDANALRVQQVALNGRPKHQHDVLVPHDKGVAKGREVMKRLLAAD